MNRLKYIVILLLFFQNPYIYCQWRLVEQFDNTPTWSKTKVQSINCWDSINCYAIVQHSTKEDYGCRIYTSSNNGISWELLLQNENGKLQMLNVKDGVSPNPNYYFILSDDNTFLEKSTDGSKTFKIITLDQNNNYPKNIVMYDINRGIVINSNNIFTTTDGWGTFERHDKNDKGQNFYSPVFLDSNTYATLALSTWSDSLGMVFMKYHLLENVWDTVSYYGKDSNWTDLLNGLYFLNDTLGFACGRRSDRSLSDYDYYDIIYKTTNGGKSWELIHKQLQRPEKGFYDISFADENNGVAVGFWGKLAMTNDGGKTWVYEPYPNEMKDCRKMLVTWAGHTPLIGTWDAGIFRYEGDFFKFPQDTVSVATNYYNNKINVLISNDNMILSIDNSGLNKYRLQIFDILGNVVLIKDLSQSKNQTINLSLSTLNNGTYFYMILSGGIVKKSGNIMLIR